LYHLPHNPSILRKSRGAHFVTAQGVGKHTSSALLTVKPLAAVSKAEGFVCLKTEL